MPTAIEFNNISKLYRLGMVSSGTLRHDLKRWWTMNIRGQEDPFLQVGETNDRSNKGASEYVWALKDIDFKVEQGDVVGIIGKNGAGKSTLLKILSRVTAPTTGTIRARGRIGSLLEVGTGFHPEMTGRENIYLNGAILGMTKQEIAKKLDEIVDFSGCERYIDTPVKRYSSGMMVRLGFAVAAHLDPEILVVDEVLAVGDAEFQKKAIGKMQDVSRGEGRTVLFVSHNMASIKALCHTGILLNNGHIQTAGPINGVVETYIGNRKDSNNSIYEDMALAPGNDKIRIREFSINPIHGNIIDVESGIHVNLVFYNASANIIIDTTFELRTADDVIVFHTGKVLSPDGNSQKGFYQVSFDIPAHTLNMGNYTLRLWFGQNQKYLLWGFYEHHFHIENTYTNQGHNLNNLPGIMKPNFDISTYFLERPWTHVS